MNVVIYQPAKTAMQSGKNKTKRWVLEALPEARKQADSLMGWIGQGKTTEQIKLFFDTQLQAVDYARSKGWTYTVKAAQTKKVRPKSYAANFSYHKVS